MVTQSAHLIEQKAQNGKALNEIFQKRLLPKLEFGLISEVSKEMVPASQRDKMQILSSRHKKAYNPKTERNDYNYE